MLPPLSASAAAAAAAAEAYAGRQTPRAKHLEHVDDGQDWRRMGRLHLSISLDLNDSWHPPRDAPILGCACGSAAFSYPGRSGWDADVASEMRHWRGRGEKKRFRGSKVREGTIDGKGGGRSERDLLFLVRRWAPFGFLVGLEVPSPCPVHGSLGL